jgi:hypothetical protein
VLFRSNEVYGKHIVASEDSSVEPVKKTRRSGGKKKATDTDADASDIVSEENTEA